jgi:hypothetical protein
MSEQPEGWSLPWQGGCRCGAVRFTVSAPPLVTMACHCRGCQRMSASAFSLSVAIPAGGFAVTEGETVLGGAGRDMHHFCPLCMSWLFTRIPGMDAFVNVRATMLDDPSWYVPYIETFRGEGLPWAFTGAARSYDGLPEPSEFDALIAAFHASGIRPGGLVARA